MQHVHSVNAMMPMPCLQPPAIITKASTVQLLQQRRMSFQPLVQRCAVAGRAAVQS
jgi:hypothetical protein